MAEEKVEVKVDATDVMEEVKLDVVEAKVPLGEAMRAALGNTASGLLSVSTVGLGTVVAALVTLTFKAMRAAVCDVANGTEATLASCLDAMVAALVASVVEVIRAAIHDAASVTESVLAVRLDAVVAVVVTSMVEAMHAAVRDAASETEFVHAGFRRVGIVAGGFASLSREQKVSLVSGGDAVTSAVALLEQKEAALTIARTAAPALLERLGKIYHASSADEYPWCAAMGPEARCGFACARNDAEALELIDKADPVGVRWRPELMSALREMAAGKPMPEVLQRALEQLPRVHVAHPHRHRRRRALDRVHRVRRHHHHRRRRRRPRPLVPWRRALPARRGSRRRAGRRL